MAAQADAGPAMVHLQRSAQESSDRDSSHHSNGTHHFSPADLEDLDRKLGEEDDSDADVDNPWTPHQIRDIRRKLHELGADKFVLEYLTSGRYTARELCRAFRKGPYKEADGLPDEHFYAYLGKAIVRELNRRQQLDKYKTIDDVVKLLQERRNIMVITGAGISTSLGIRDFRSKNTGLYAMLKEENDPEVQEPEDVFEINMFDTRPDIFYKYAGGVLPDLKDWTPTHEFIRLLQDKEKLLTNYSQNIDNIESHAGIRKDKYLQCHGSWAMATCRKCKYQIPGEEIFAAVKAQQPAKCKACIKKIATQKPGMKRKRSSNGSKKRRKAGNDDSDSDGAYDIQTPGIMKPDITFFGEALPDTFFDRLNKQDRDKVDLVIVIGSSMKVEPVCAVPDYLPRHVPHVLINRDPIQHINFDVTLLGDCDVVVDELARRAGWDLKHHMIPEGQQADVVPIDELERQWAVIRKDG